MTCRKCMDDVKTGGFSLLRDKSGGRPDFGLGGIRHGGGVTSVQARGRNLGTCRSDAKGEVQVGGTHEDERIEAEHRGGAARSVCLTADASGGLKSHSARDPGLISKGEG